MPEDGRAPSVDLPSDEDARDIGPMHLRAWHESYVDAARGVDPAWIRANIGFVTEPASVDYRLDIFRRQSFDPTDTLYRTVHVLGEVAGFLHAESNGTLVTLEGLYLLDHLKGTGMADRLMDLFDEWSAGLPAHLDVISYNDRAIGFYRRHAFADSGRRILWKDVVPVTGMERP